MKFIIIIVIIVFLFGSVCAKKTSNKDLKSCFLAFLMVGVRFYQTCGFHSDLAAERRRCIRPGFICRVLGFFCFFSSCGAEI